MAVAEGGFHRLLGRARHRHALDLPAVQADNLAAPLAGQRDLAQRPPAAPDRDHAVGGTGEDRVAGLAQAGGQGQRQMRVAEGAVGAGQQADGGAPGGGYGGGPGGGQGGSFLGTAAATAAGMIGGGLLLGGIRNMLGGRGAQAGPFAGTFDHLSSGGAPPLGGGGGSGDLARRAGLDDIGRTPGGGGSEGTRAGLLDSSHDEGDDQDSDGDDDDTDGDDDSGNDDSGDGSDYP